MLRAYYHDTRTTAESNTQLAVLEPLRRWNRSSELHETLTASLHAVSFYHKEFGCISDAPASAVFTNETIADGWYVLNPMVKVAELAVGGDEWAKELLLKSIDHIIFLGRALDCESRSRARAAAAAAAAAVRTVIVALSANRRARALQTDGRFGTTR